jgi:zinc transport system substrate-binding protein
MKILSFIFFCALAMGCSTPPPHPSSKKSLLLVSIPPYQTLVREVAGEQFEVETVVPLNGDPHTYEPTSKQTRRLSEGQIWFQIGEPFEKKITPLLTNTKKVDLRKGIAMIGGSCCHPHAGEEDRHLWLSPKNLSIQAEAIGAALIAHYPNEREAIEKRLLSLQKELKNLDLELQTTTQASPYKTFLVSHPAFAYFCRDYGYEQLSVEQEGKDPLPKELDALLASAVSAHAKVAIAIPQHSQRGIARIANELQIPTRVIDPYAPDYRETLKSVAIWVAKGLSKNKMSYFDSARQSQIEGFPSERGDLSPCGKDDEEDRFDKAAASQNGLGSCLTAPNTEIAHDTR